MYNQALLRYNDMVKKKSTKPTPVVVLKGKEPTTTTDIVGEVVTTLPKELQEKGHQLVSRLNIEVVMTLPKALYEKGDGVTFKHNKVEQYRRDVARRSGRIRQCRDRSCPRSTTKT